MDKRLLGYINWALLACMLLLYFTGVANLYSASGTRVETGFAFESFYQRQLVWGLCGLASRMQPCCSTTGNCATWPGPPIWSS